MENCFEKDLLIELEDYLLKCQPKCLRFAYFGLASIREDELYSDQNNHASTSRMFTWATLSLASTMTQSKLHVFNATIYM